MQNCPIILTLFLVKVVRNVRLVRLVRVVKVVRVVRMVRVVRVVHPHGYGSVLYCSFFQMSKVAVSDQGSINSISDGLVNLFSRALSKQFKKDKMSQY